MKTLFKKILFSVAQIFLFIVFTGWATEVKAEDGNTNLDIINLYAPYKPQKKSSASKNKRYASAYRLRETPYLVVKTNVLHDLSSSMNLGFEAMIAQKVTLDFPVTYNPWTYNKKENSKFKFILFQPELRYWLCETFDGHFFGIHAHYAYFNVGHLLQPALSDLMNQYRNEGQLAGVGVSYGYVWTINARWGFEVEIGAGYAHLWYDKFPCLSCVKMAGHEKKNYFGITRAGLSLIYYIF